jgi:hypothetical protein
VHVIDACIPLTLKEILLVFAPCFTRPAQQTFATLMTGWICCPGRHSISRLIQAASSLRKKHHSSFYRFLSHGAWTTDSLAKTLFHLLLPLLPKAITLIADDTLCVKGGPHIFGAAMHFDARASTYGRKAAGGAQKFFAFGHNWVVAALWVPLPWSKSRGLAIPFMIRLYRSKKRCPEPEFRKRTELAAEIVRIVAGWVPRDRRLYVVADAEYACKTVVRSLPERVIFIGPMVMDAALFDLPDNTKPRLGRPRKKGAQMPSPEKLARDTSIPWSRLPLIIYSQRVDLLVKQQRCLWYTVAGSKRVTMIVTRDPAGRLRDRAFFSTDDQVSAENLLILFARRWEIEVAFRNTKQAMGIEDPQNGWWRRQTASPRPEKRPGPNPHKSKGKTAINHTLAVAFAAYAVVVIWYLRHGKPDEDVRRVKREAPWYRHKATPSFTDMLAALRRELWIARLSSDPLFDRLSRKLDAVLPLWMLAA